MTTAPLTPEARALLRKLAEAAVAHEPPEGHEWLTSVSCAALRAAIAPATILALLDALEAAQKDAGPAKLAELLAQLIAERDGFLKTIEKLKARVVELDEARAERDALERTVAGYPALMAELRAECARLKAEAAEAAGLLRRARETKILKHWPSCDVTPCHCLLEDIDRLVAQHQRPPEERGAK